MEGTEAEESECHEEGRPFGDGGRDAGGLDNWEEQGNRLSPRTFRRSAALQIP